MVIKSQHVVGLAGAFALVGAAVWASTVWLNPQQDATVEITQMPERSWAVEITDLGAADAVPAEKRTASTR
jgi:hypothetical protein